MSRITAVLGDITKQKVDVIVNAANHRMRGGGGVDGAIHRAGGITLTQDCIDRFPDGLATGDADWTTAGNLPARWVVHAVGPNYGAGQTDPALLESCYGRALEVADELGAKSVAFPLISAGIYAWPLRDAVDTAVRTLAETPTKVEDIRVVAFSEDLDQLVRRVLAHRAAHRILEGVQVLLERGYPVRALPGMSPSGIHWRVVIAPASAFTEKQGVVRLPDDASAIYYSSAAGTEFAGGEVTAGSTPEEVADLILGALPAMAETSNDRAYADWYAGLLDLCAEHQSVPIAYTDYFDDAEGWEIGWGSGIRYAAPPQ